MNGPDRRKSDSAVSDKIMVAVSCIHTLSADVSCAGYHAQRTACGTGEPVYESSGDFPRYTVVALVVCGVYLYDSTLVPAYRNEMKS